MSGGTIVVMETCDLCGPTTPATHKASPSPEGLLVQPSAMLTLCDHHTREQRDKLAAKGWVVDPLKVPATA